ncbi:MAG: alcohol dehydrogenase catalytic domain-containing protein, partial [Janthinobacterium lividum]
MKITAAVVKEKGAPFVLEEAELDQPQPQEVLVRIVATGICHTDMVIRNQQMAAPLPMVLGHEGAGVVEAIGIEVTEVAVGDHVVLTFGYCGKCDSCREGFPTYCEHMLEHNFA